MHVANNYWTIDKGIEATKYLIETKLKWNREDICNNYCKQIFIDNDLYGMIQVCFNASPFLAINSTYPNEFQPFELKRIHRGYWNKTSCIDAVCWLFFDNLKLSKEEAINIVSRDFIIEHGLATVLNYITIKDIVTYLDKINI